MCLFRKIPAPIVSVLYVFRPRRWETYYRFAVLAVRAPILLIPCVYFCSSDFCWERGRYFHSFGHHLFARCYELAIVIP